MKPTLDSVHFEISSIESEEMTEAGNLWITSSGDHARLDFDSKPPNIPRVTESSLNLREAIENQYPDSKSKITELEVIELAEY